MQLGHFDGLAALHDAQMGEALLAAAGVVLQVASFLMTPLMTLKKVMRPAKGSVMVLKTTRPAGSLSATLRKVVGVGRRRVAVRHGTSESWTAIGSALDGRGRVDLDEVEQVVEGHVGQAAGKEHGEDAVFADGLVERGDEVLFGDGALLEVLLHQLVFAFGDQLDESLVAGLGVGGQAGGNLAGDLAAAIAAGGVDRRPPW